MNAASSRPNYLTQAELSHSTCTFRRTSIDTHTIGFPDSNHRRINISADPVFTACIDADRPNCTTTDQLQPIEFPQFMHL